MKLTSILTLSVLIFTFGSEAFAISNQDLVSKCLEVGKAKIASQAKSYGCRVNLNRLEVQEIDNRWYNPSKYVWYQVVQDCNGYDRIIQMVQYYQDKCF